MYREMTRDPAAERIAAKMAALEAENARLRGLLRVHTVADRLHLSPGEAHVLVVLYDAAKPMTGPSILRLTPAAWRGLKSNLASMNVARIRQKMGAESIETLPTGYHLSERLRARVQIVLEDAT